MRTILMGLAVAAGTATGAQAATMLATFTGNVTAGLDATGEFLAPGTAFSGEGFRLDVIYDTSKGEKLRFVMADGSSSDQVAGGTTYPSASGYDDPILQATLEIGGRAFSMPGDSSSWLFDVIHAPDSMSYWQYPDDLEHQWHHDTEFNRMVTVIQDQVSTGTKAGVGREIDNRMIGMFYSPLPTANLTAEFSSDLSDTVLRKYWDTSFQLTDCSWTAGYDSRICTRDAQGTLTSTALTVTRLSGSPERDPTPSPVPLPASGALLGFALAGAGALARRRRG